MIHLRDDFCKLRLNRLTLGPHLCKMIFDWLMLVNKTQWSQQHSDDEEEELCQYSPVPPCLNCNNRREVLSWHERAHQDTGVWVCHDHDQHSSSFISHQPQHRPSSPAWLTIMFSIVWQGNMPPNVIHDLMMHFHFLQTISSIPSILISTSDTRRDSKCWLSLICFIHKIIY